MRIYSWNMLFRNPDLDRAFSFIRGTDFDIFCLQEVPERLLERLHSLPCKVIAGKDVDRIERDGSITRTYCVILSRFDVTGKRSFSVPELLLTARTRLFIKLMYPAGWQELRDQRGLFADLLIPSKGRVRLFCLHLTLSHPKQLFDEFDTVSALYDPSVPNLICGDFNILEKPHITILNWILGGRFSDAFAWRKTRRILEVKFEALGLRNPLRGAATQTLSRSQLDHILVPQNLRILNAKVLKDRHGSDHNPVFVECE